MWMTSWRGLTPRSWERVEFGHPPSIVLRADQPVIGHEHVVEEDLVELGLAGQLHQRPRPPPEVVHVDDQVGDALVLGRLGISAGQADARIGELGIGGPHLLAADQPAALHPGGPVEPRPGHYRLPAR